MPDVLHVMDAIRDVFHRMQFVLHLPWWEAGLLLAAIVLVGARLIVAWRRDELPGPVVVVLLMVLLAAEGLMVRWIPDFERSGYLLAVAAPIIVWATVDVLRSLRRKRSLLVHSEFRELQRTARERDAADRRARGRQR